MKRFDFKFLEIAFAMLLLSMTPEKEKILKDGDHIWDRLTKKKKKRVGFYIDDVLGCMLTDGMHECLGSSGVPIKGDSCSDFFLGYRRNGKKKTQIS